MRIGAKILLYNDVMRKRRNELGLTQRDLAQAVGVTPEFVGCIERLICPGARIDYVRKGMLGIADILDMNYDLLFPPDYIHAIQNNLLPRERDLTFVKDISIDTLPPGLEPMYLPAPDDIIDAEWLAREIKQALESLPERERAIIEYLYGFTDGDGIKHSLNETACRFAVTTERIRQLEAQALSRLRHPQIRKNLRPYCEE